MELEWDELIQVVPVTRNFKLPLLAHVKALTVGDHSLSDCESFVEHLAHLPQLKTVRLVPDRIDFLRDQWCLCVRGEICPLVISLNPEHLVYRNIGAEGLITPLFWNWEPTNLKLLTYIFPSDGRTFKVERDFLNVDLMEGHRKVPRIRFVFSHDEGKAREVGIDTLLEGSELEDVDGVTMEDIFLLAYRDLTELLS